MNAIILKAQQSPHIILFIWLTTITLYRLLVLTQAHFGLYYDEAYYVHWSHILDWGYYSKPPMVAWLISFSTFLFGEKEFAIKAISPIAYALTSWLIFLIANQLTKHKYVPLVSSVIFSTTFLAGFNSTFITTDAALYFFWALSCYLFLQALTKNSFLSWISLGAALGLGMLSKYTFAALPIGFIFYLALTKKYDYFISLKAWTAAILGLLIFSLNLYWNWQNEFISFNHTREIAKLEGNLIKPGAFIEFILTQVFIFGLFWIFAIIRKRKTLKHVFNKADAFTFILCTTIPILAIISFQALLSRAFGNWAGPFTITMSILAAAAAVQMTKRFNFSAIAFHLILLSLFYHWPVILNSLDIEQSKKNSPYYRLTGWRELGGKIEPIILQHPNAKILSPSRDLLAYMGFYTGRHVNDLIFWNPNENYIANHYDLKNNLRDQPYNRQASFILLLKSPIEDRIANRFSIISDLGIHTHQVSEHIVRTVFLYQVSGFKGYLQK